MSSTKSKPQKPKVKLHTPTKIVIGLGIPLILILLAGFFIPIQTDSRCVGAFQGELHTIRLTWVNGERLGHKAGEPIYECAPNTKYERYLY